MDEKGQEKMAEGEEHLMFTWWYLLSWDFPELSELRNRHSRKQGAFVFWVPEVVLSTVFGHTT